MRLASELGSVYALRRIGERRKDIERCDWKEVGAGAKMMAGALIAGLDARNQKNSA